MIKEFKNQYKFLSNMFVAPFITIDTNPINKSYGSVRKWTSSEHFYQAHKFENTKHFDIIQSLNSPYDTKNYARKHTKETTAEQYSKFLNIKMLEAVLYKFTQNHDIKQLLINTENQNIVEGNYWHDNYWGNCSCNKCQNITGKNYLGKILMKIRDLIK